MTAPINQFLGPEVDPESPLSLLAVDPATLTDEVVIAALRARLAVLADHPRSESPEADEVRLLLHAAAARLLDPALRWEYASSAPERPAGEGPQSAEAAVLLTLGMFGGWNRESLRRLMLIAESQGISQQQLIELVQGLGAGGHSPGAAIGPGTASSRSASPVARATIGSRPTEAAPVPSPAGPAHSGAPAPTRADAEPWPTPAHVDPVVGIVKGAGVAVVAGLLGLIAVGAVIVIYLDDRTPPAPAPQQTRQDPPSAPVGPVATAPSGAGPVTKTPQPGAPPDAPQKELFPAPDPGATPAPASPPRERVGDFGDVLRGLSAANAGLSIDRPQALRDFAAAAAACAREWTGAPADAQTAALNQILDFVYRVSNDPADTRAALVAVLPPPLPAGPPPAKDIAPLTWSAGVLARLSRERELPSPAREEVRTALARVFPPSRPLGESSLRAGVTSYLMSLPDSLMSAEAEADPKATALSWAAWQKVSDAIAAGDAALAQRLRLAALDKLLTEGPEPNQSQVVLDAISSLTSSLTWRRDEQSRRALLRWFDSREVSTADLFALTSTLATRSSAEGVDYSMALSAAATDAQRAELRARYASVWNLDTEEARGTVIDRFASAAREALSAEASRPADEFPSTDLARAAQLATIADAGAKVWKGNTEGAAAAFAAIETIIAPQTFGVPTAPGSRPWYIDVSGVPPGQGWAARYLAANQHVANRREILSQVAQAPSPGEAEILVQEACRGSPAQIRTAARELVDRYSAHPTVVNALLEFLPSLPPTRDNADLVRRVAGSAPPSPRDPSFRPVVRRLLVERLIELLASSADRGFADGAAQHLALAYASRDLSAPAPEPDPAQPAPAPIDAETAVEMEVARLSHEARSLVPSGKEPFTLPSLEAARSARSRVASGRVQAFAAGQIDAFELLAWVCVAERPSRADQVAEIVREVTDARRTAPHIYSQCRAVERANLRLWLLRFGLAEQ
ncbi:MAG: hypothetical protein IT433_01655 [Phycisphaerales bacterium]|nr:hypothetical protein [Phycisphaerales bacterium]